MRLSLLLIEDVEDLGKSGEVVSAKAGYARNYLLPKQLAIIAEKHTLRMQEKLKKERAVRSEKHKIESEKIAAMLDAKTFTIEVKVDAEGKMYGSVSLPEVLHLVEKEGIVGITKKMLQIRKHIKDLGTIEIPVKLKEDVMTKIKLEVLPEAGSEFLKRQEEAKKKAELEKEVKTEKRKAHAKEKEQPAEEIKAETNGQEEEQEKKEMPKKRTQKKKKTESEE